MVKINIYLVANLSFLGLKIYYFDNKIINYIQFFSYKSWFLVINPGF